MNFVESEIAHLGPIMLPDVRHDRPQRPWWEAARLHSMRHYLGEGDRLLDVGAEMGDMSALFASWGVDVFLVEPNPKAWPWIKATFEANGLQPVGWYRGLLGGLHDGSLGGGMIGREYIEKIGFAWPSSDWMWKVDYDDPDPETGFYHLDEHSGVVPVYTLDELCEDIDFRPTAITVDIEGGEIKLIEGMNATLDLYRPKVWMSIHDEFISDRYGLPHSTGHTVIDNYFEHMGYDSIFLAHDHERHVLYLPKEMGWRW